jgi:hypothetical protein
LCRRPSELPIQFSIKLELVINSNTAKAIGLTIPETFPVSANDDGPSCPLWVISGSADHVDGLPRTRPVHLS